MTEKLLRRKYTADDRCAFCGTIKGGYTFVDPPVDHVVCYPCIAENLGRLLRPEDHRPKDG